MNKYLRNNALNFTMLAVLMVCAMIAPHAHAAAHGLMTFAIAGQMIRCSDINNVPTTGTATYGTTELDEYSVYALHFYIGLGAGSTLTRAMIGRVQVTVAGVDVVNNITAARLQSINQWKGDDSTDATKLSFYFGNPDMVSERDIHYTDLDLSHYKAKDGTSPAKVTVQLDITGATLPTVYVYGEARDKKANFGFTDNGVSLTKRFYNSILTPTGVIATQQNQDIVDGKADGAKILHEHWFPTNLVDVEVKLGQRDLWQKLTVAQAQHYALGKGHPTQAGHMVISPTIEGFTDNAWDSAGNYQHLITTTATDNIPVYIEAAVPSLVTQAAQAKANKKVAA